MSDSAHPKPMRLGTRSCAECRRRKVRCVFPAADPPCQQCGLRGIPCTAQQPAKQDATSSRALSLLGEERLKQRLADIEIEVHDIWASLSATGASSSHIEALPGFPSTTRSLEGCVDAELQPMLGALSTSSESATHATTPDESDIADDRLGFQDAPLLTLVKAAGMTDELQFASFEPSPNDSKPSDNAHLPEFPMMQDDDLLTILAATEQYWPIWPPWQYGAVPSSMRTLQTGGVEFAARFLSHMARSSSPCIAAKALLWLSLCIQQAPKTLRLARGGLSQQALLASYMQTADSLLMLAAGTGETLHAIEARLIQQRLYMNMGWPRQAWLTLRRAADGALLMRLHRAPDQGGGREVAIWTEIWHLETSCALILGLPCTLPIPDNDDSINGCGNPLRTLHHRMCILAASVVARNQSPQPSYPTTVQIGHELDSCKALMPNNWWHEPPELDEPLAQLYARQATQMQYFLIAKMLHLPFMLSTDAAYEYSRASAVAASRGQITAYLGLRSCTRGLFVVCEMLEFQAFSAGITLLIHLLSPASSAGGPSDEDDNSNEDWPLIETLTRSLRRTADLMRCKVASQAAEVLGLLTQAARGTYAGPERYAVVLPYFGKVTINLSRNRETTDMGGQDESQQPQQQPASPFGTVEFSANPFDLVHFPGNVDGELGGDWMSMADVDVAFDWTQTFSFDNNNNNNNSSENL